jgi:hypothetical protein
LLRKACNGQSGDGCYELGMHTTSGETQCEIRSARCHSSEQLAALKQSTAPRWPPHKLMASGLGRATAWLSTFSQRPAMVAMRWHVPTRNA